MISQQNFFKAIHIVKYIAVVSGESYIKLEDWKSSDEPKISELFKPYLMTISLTAWCKVFMSLQPFIIDCLVQDYAHN